MTGSAATTWPRVRLKHLFSEIDRRAGADSMTLLSVSIHRGVLPRAEMSDRESRADDFAMYKRVAVGDLVINRMRAFEGGAGVSAQDGMVSMDYAVLRAGPRLLPRYLHYLVRSHWFVGEMTARLRGIGNVEVGNVRTPRINVEDLGLIEVPLPPIGDQRTIADYLDSESARIDETIAVRRRQQAATVQERFESQLSASLLEAGFPYAPVRRLFRVQNGSTPTSQNVDYWDGDIVWLTPQELSSGEPVVSRSARMITAAGLASCGATLVPPDSIVLSTRAPIGSVALAGTELCTNQGCKSLVATVPVDPWFFYFVFVASRANLESLGQGSTFVELSTDGLLSFEVPVPELTQQRRVGGSLREAHAGTRLIVARLYRQIDLLLERRQALITAAVTGQLAIAGVAA